MVGVAELDRQLQRVVEQATARLLVRGEVSGLRRAGSGHCYFTLKDEHEEAVVDCVMYRSASARARRMLQDGELMVLAAQATVYARRGRLQLIVRDVVQTARGALMERRAQIKAALEAEGVFAPERKRPLPRDPRWIVVLTSRSGAAIHDFIRVAHRRGAVRITLVPTPVQGPEAAPRIVGALARADQLGADVLVVTRGGGSAEDLAAYDDPELVRAVAQTTTPVVSAVGHEIDQPLTDLAADARAATPSHAAELLVADDVARYRRLRMLVQRLAQTARHGLARRRHELADLQRSLGEPRRRLLVEGQHLDELRSRLERAAGARLREHRLLLDGGRRRLDRQHPRRVLQEARRRIEPSALAMPRAMAQLLARDRARLAVTPRLERALQRQLEERRELARGWDPALRAGWQDARATAARRLGEAVARLDALSPLAVLGRGYAIVQRGATVVRGADELRAGDRVRLRLGRGAVEAEVTSVDPDGDARRDGD